MSDNIVRLEPADGSAALKDILTKPELFELAELRKHPATIGHILFDSEADILECENIDDSTAPIFANVFEISDSLTAGFGQREHVTTVFEGRGMEITCRRLSAARLVVFRAKSGKIVKD